MPWQFMEKETKTTALVTVISIATISVFQINNKTLFDMNGMGFYCFFLGLFTGVAGVVISLFPTIAKYGQGLLIGGGLVILIGFSICTNGFGLVK